MANMIQIKRSLTTANPTGLANGEFAYTSNGEVLFLGANGGIDAIAGKRYPGTLTANQALVANATSGIDKIIVANAVITSLYANGSLGTAGQSLYSNGSVAYWHETLPAVSGSNTQVQFNDSGTSNAVSSFTFDKTTGTVSATNFSGNGASVTSVNAATLGGNTAADLRSYASSIAGTAYSNATSYADSAAGTAYTNAVAYAASNTYVNSTFATNTYVNSTFATNTYATTIAGTAYSNAVSYADSKAATAYSNAVSYADSKAATAYSNATSYADTAAATAYSNATSYADTAAGTAYTNAVAYAASNTYVNTYFAPKANPTFTGTVNAADVSVSGNLTVTGTLTTVGTENLIVKDPLIKLAANNTSSDVLDIGLYGSYGTTPSFTGLFRDHTDGVYKLFTGLTAEPTTTVNTSGAGYAEATLQAYLNSSALVTNSSVTNITANSTVAVTITANTLTLTTALAATSGGTGQNTYTSGDLLVANTGNALSKLSLGTSGYVLQSNGSALIYSTIDGGTF